MMYGDNSPNVSEYEDETAGEDITKRAVRLRET